MGASMLIRTEGFCYKAQSIRLSPDWKVTRHARCGNLLGMFKIGVHLQTLEVDQRLKLTKGPGCKGSRITELEISYAA